MTELVELLRTLPEGPGWAVMGLCLLLIFGPTRVLSKRAAEENYWLISAAARRWQDRKQRAIERDSQIEAAEIQIIRRDLARVARNYEADRRRWEASESELRRENHRLQRYLVELTRWMRETDLRAAAAGLELDPPPDVADWLAHDEGDADED